MSTKEALIQEIMKQPEPLLKELQHYLDYLLIQEHGKNRSSWPQGYFDQTAGAFGDEPLERPPQTALEKRGDW